MTQYLLDTNIAIELMRGRNRPVLERLASLDPGCVALSAVTVAQLHFGASLSQHPERSLLRCGVFCRAFRVLPLTQAAARRSGRFRANLESAVQRIGAYDVLIAGIAASSNRILVTHNTREFGRIAEITLEDWNR